MTDDEGPQYSVYQFFPNDFYEEVARWVAPREAVEIAHRLTESLGAVLGTTRRVIITDGDDNTVFQWEFGKGVTFGLREEQGSDAVRLQDHDPKRRLL